MRDNTPAINAIILLSSLVVCALLLGLMLRYEPPAPAVNFRFPVVDPGAASYCPGDVMSFRQEMHIVNTPATLHVAKTVWSVADERTVIWDEEPDWANYTAPAVVRQSVTYTIPQLMPGAYELRVAIGGEGWRTAAYVAPFAVRVGCGE